MVDQICTESYSQVVTEDPQHESPAVAIDRHEVRRRRHLCGLSQAQLAERAAISFAYVGHIERGQRPRVSAPVFARICDALGVQDRQELIAQDGAA